jgi:eukaryotic-like serine/threonine-protein kinase
MSGRNRSANVARVPEIDRTGSLLTAAVLVEAMQGDSDVDMSALKTLGNDTLAELWRWLDGLPPMVDACKLRLLGIAHGWSGMLLATLRWCHAAPADLPAGLGARLDQVAGLAQAASDGLR